MSDYIQQFGLHAGLAADPEYACPDRRPRTPHDPTVRYDKYGFRVVKCQFCGEILHWAPALPPVYGSVYYHYTPHLISEEPC